MPKEEKAIIMNLQYDAGDKTAAIWRGLRDDSQKPVKLLFKSLLIHATNTNFDAVGGPIKWEEEK